MNFIVGWEVLDSSVVLLIVECTRGKTSEKSQIEGIISGERVFTGLCNEKVGVVAGHIGGCENG